MWDLIVSVPDHCLSFYFESVQHRASRWVTREYRYISSVTTMLKTPLMKIEKVVLRNERRGIRSISLRQFVSTFSETPMINLSYNIHV